MRIATYNIWNSEIAMPRRIECIVNEIKCARADLICLQEVHNKTLAVESADKAGFSYCFFDHYRNSEEGLCVLSRIPFNECDSWLDKANAIFCSFMVDNKEVSVVNLHLPWNSVAEREMQIIEIIDAIDAKTAEYTYLAGDFNCADTSDLHRFLIGDCLIDGKESKPCWYDLALAYAESEHADTECTLNFRENPRFVHNTIELNARFDRILLRNTYPNDFPVLRECATFGKTVYEDIQLAASDHYGVVVDICDYQEI